MAASMIANTAGKMGMDLLNLTAKPGAVKLDDPQGLKLIEMTDDELYTIAGR